jgi:hypothetical protein
MIYLKMPSEPYFPPVGGAVPEITSEKERAYFIVDESGAEIERSKMASLHPGYDWKVCPTELSHETGYIVVGHPRAA